jgi:hypothetical protein
LALIKPILEWPLERLYITETKLSEAAVRDMIARQRKLLSFSGTGKNLTDNAILGLKEAPELLTLELTETAVTTDLFVGPGFAKLHALLLINQVWPAESYSKLRGINLYFFRIKHQPLNREDLVEIAKLKNVKRLTLSECPVNPSAWEEIAAATQLQELNLYDTCIKPEQLPYLKKLTELRELAVYQEGLTVEQLLPLADLPNLEKLDCNQLSSEDVMRLDRLINEPRLLENARKGHLAGYAITEEQVKKLGLRQPIRMDLADDVRFLENEHHWYPPKWLSEAWDKQVEPPASEEHKDWFPSPPEKVEAEAMEK